MKLYLILVSLALVTVISGCNQVNVDEQLFKAQLALAGKKYKESEILLKNVLLESPDNGEANNLLAATYFWQGKMENAEKQFNRAFRQNSLSDETRIFWLQTALLQQDFDGLEEVINKIKVPAIDEAIEFYSLYTPNDTVQSSSIKTDKEPPSLGIYARAQACVRLRLEGDYPEALACLEAFENEQAFILEHALESANNHIALGNTKEYASEVGKVSALFPEYGRYQLLEADALVKLQDFEAAARLVSQLLEEYPKQPYLNYLQAVIDSKNDNAESAKLFAELAISYGFDNQNSRTIAALSAYRLGNFEQAYNHFKSFSKEIDSTSILQRIYSLTLIRLGYAEEATDSFNSIEVLEASDYPLFESAANYLESVGNRGMASSILERFESAIMAGDENYAALNISRLKLNDLKALQNLETLNTARDADKEVVLALADYYVNTGDVESAIRSADELQTIFNDNYAASIVKGRIYDLTEAYSQAKDAFTQAASINQDSVSALAFFIDDAVRNEKLVEAEKYAKDLYELLPNSPATLNKYLHILKRQGKESTLMNVAKNAYLQNSSSAVHSAMYGSLLMSEDSHEQALQVLNEVKYSASLPPLFWLTKTRSELAIDKPKEAEATVETWLSYNRAFKPAYLFAANVFERTGNTPESINVLEKAERVFPGDDEIYIINAFYLIQQGNLDDAKGRLNKVSANSRSLIGYKGVKGQLLLAEGEFNRANKLLAEYYEYAKDYQSLNLLVQVLIKMSRRGEALDLVSTFVINNPNNASGVELLAELYIGEDHKQSLMLYKRLIELEPTNHAAYNNSAWLLHLNGQNSEALSYSQRALELMPQNPEYLDTHGMILLRLGQVDESIKALLTSVTMKPNSVAIRLHLAEAFKLSGLDTESDKLLNGINTTIPQMEAEIQRIRSL